MSSKSRSQSYHLGSRDGGSGELKLSYTTSLIFDRISRALPELIPVFGRGERIISKDWVGGWDYRFKQNVLCHVTVYCTVIPCVCVVLYPVVGYRFVSVIRILKCTAANYVNKLISVLH